MVIKFYEKPGCVNNTKQKEMLKAAGHEVIAFSLLEEKWEAEVLKSFFSGMPIADWFNPSAPRIKSGEVVPSCYDDGETAVIAMLNDPLLIRRPLIDVEGKKVCGFNNELVNSLLNNADVSHVQTCPNLANPCD